METYATPTNDANYSCHIKAIDQSYGVYRLMQNFGGEIFGEFGKTNVIRQYLPSQIPDSLK